MSTSDWSVTSIGEMADINTGRRSAFMLVRVRGAEVRVDLSSDDYQKLVGIWEDPQGFVLKERDVSTSYEVDTDNQRDFIESDTDSFKADVLGDIEPEMI